VVVVDCNVAVLESSMSRGLRRSGARREAAALLLRLTYDAIRFGLFGPVNEWSYSTFPPPIQSELFYTDSESDQAQSQQMPGAFKPPPQAPVRYTCVQDPGEASLGSLLLCVGRMHIIIDP
jgi:hypothetical protein